MSEPIEYRLTMTSEHRAALIQALTIVGRAGMGQFTELFDLFVTAQSLKDDSGDSLYDRRRVFELDAKTHLTPELARTGAYYGIRNDKTPMTSKLAWELLEALTNPPHRCEGLSGQPLPTLKPLRSE